MRQVERAMQEAGIPPGARVNLAGHSQGGNVAMMLADTQAFVDRYRIESVTTFGSPPNVPINPRLGQQRYHNFAFPTDPVPYSTSPLAMGLVGGLLLRFAPLLSASLFSAPVAPRFKNTIIPELPGVGDAHGSYKDSPYLQQQALPFQIKEWRVLGTYDSGPYDVLRQELDDAVSGDRAFSQRLAGAGDAWIDIHKQAALTTFQNLVTRATYDAPVPLRTAVDRGLDWLGTQITTGPRPSEAIENSVRGVIDAANTTYRGQLRIADGVQTGATQFVAGQINGELRIFDGLNQANRTVQGSIAHGTSDILRGDIIDGGVTIADGIIDGGATAAKGYVEGVATNIDGTFKGVESVAKGTIDGAAQVAGGVWHGAASIGTGIRDFLF